MKTISIILGAAFLVIAGVMISLLTKGGALKPAGVIKPAEVGADVSAIGKQIAVRLFPDFDASTFAVWHMGAGTETLDEVARVAHANLKNRVVPSFHDLRQPGEVGCRESCWFVHKMGEPLPEPVRSRVTAAPTVDIYVQYFDRDEPVPEVCEQEKILDPTCMRPVAVREVRRKFKTQAPYYFMQRYQRAEFYLFVERPRL